jgi:hypothetical protein
LTDGHGGCFCILGKRKAQHGFSFNAFELGRFARVAAVQKCLRCRCEKDAFPVHGKHRTRYGGRVNENNSVCINAIQSRCSDHGCGRAVNRKEGADAASDAIIIGFQVRPALPARRLAEKEGVEIRLYSIIYDAIEEVKSAMEGMLSPEIKEEITANVEVLQVFKITKVGTIAGCMVREGKIKRSNKVRVIRDGIVVHSGELESLKRFKDDVKEVVAGLDCGLNIVNYNDIQVGDIIEAYEETEIKKTL